MVDPDQPNPPHGKSLIAKYRAERLASRLADRVSRQASRQILRAERLNRLGRPPVADTHTATPDTQPSPGVSEAPQPSIFAQIVAQERRVHAATAQLAEDAGPPPETAPPDSNPDLPADCAKPLAGAAEGPGSAAGQHIAHTLMPAAAPFLPGTALHPAAFGHDTAQPDTVPAADLPTGPAAAPTPELSAVPSPPAFEIVPPAAVPNPPPQPEPAPLTSLGFGPGMTARLHHLGIFTVTDLATSEAAALKTLLGDVGDLVNVEYWITQARSLLKQAA